MEQPLVSILMAAYNQEKFIGEAIESVLASTYRNFELIIVDDCSPDSTYMIANGYAAKDNRIRLYKNEKNLGDYPNRNRVASYAKGKYIKYIDGDDAIYYWGLQVQVEMMERFSEVAYGLDGVMQDDYRMFPYALNPVETYHAVYVKRMDLFDKAPTSCIIRREIFELEGGFKTVKYTGDCEMWHRLSIKYSVLVMPAGIGWARAHEGSELSKAKENMPSMSYQYILLRRTFLLREDCPLNLNIKRKIIAAMAKSQIGIIIKLLIKMKFNEASRIKKTDSLGLLDLLKIHVFF